MQCQHGRCQVAFHPECGKDFFTNTRDKTGYDEVSIYCPAHKPLKLRRVLEGKEKKCVEDIISFCKFFERYEKRLKNMLLPQPVKRVSNVEKPFTYKEKDKFIKAVDKEIQKLVKNNTSEFSWIIKLKSASLRNNIEVNCPKQYNLFDPLALLQNKFSIPGRKVAECHKYYTSSLYKLLKQELVLMNLEIKPFIPKTKKKMIHSINIKKSLEKYREKIKNREKNKEPQKDKKKTEVTYMQTFIDLPVLNDIISTDIFCICRKPFVEKSYKKPWESETDFSIRQALSQMIQCDTCDEWFHYKCIGLKYDVDPPESYICESCMNKTAEVHIVENSI